MMVKRSRDDSLSSSSDIESYEPDNPVVVKYVQIDQSKPSKQQAEVMRCLFPPHRQPVTFSTYDDYDTHYKKFHQNRCSECHKNLPTNHFLNLHIAEIHDPLNEARRARGDKTVRRPAQLVSWLRYVSVCVLRGGLHESLLHSPKAKDAPCR